MRASFRDLPALPRSGGLRAADGEISRVCGDLAREHLGDFTQDGRLLRVKDAERIIDDDATDGGGKGMGRRAGSSGSIWCAASAISASVGR